MKFREMYRMHIYCRGNEKRLENYVVSYKAEGKNTIRIKVEELLMMAKGDELCCENGNVKCMMLDMLHVKVQDAESIVYSGFHEMREEVRAYMRKEGVSRQLEEINRKMAFVEFDEYMHMEEDERGGFSKYFKERFPKKTKKKYDYNIGYMFRHYKSIFEDKSILENEHTPKERYVYEEIEFRTGDRGYGDTYRYPICIKHEKIVPTYRAKAAICTVYEMELRA